MIASLSRGLPWTVLSAFILASLVAPVAADARSSYCSPSGDFCQGAFKEGGSVILDLRTFSFRGMIEVCVTKRTRVCRDSRLRRSGPLYVSRVSWNGRFPNQGRGTYLVRWYKGGTRIGTTISFRR